MDTLPPVPPTALPADALVDALNGDVAAQGALLQAWQLAADARWSPIDVVAQNRRLCANQNTKDARRQVELIDATVAAAWARALQRFDPAEPLRLAPALKCLGLLSQRFPAKPIHDALYAALLAADALLLQLDDAGQRERCRQVLAAVLVPTWHKTLDRASKTWMTGALKTRALYAPPDVFVGWMMAWRFGIDRAQDYLEAVTSVPALLNPLAPPPLSSAADMDWFTGFLRDALPQTARLPWLMHLVGAGPSQAPGDDALGTLIRIDRMLRDAPVLSAWHVNLVQAINDGLALGDEPMHRRADGDEPLADIAPGQDDPYDESPRQMLAEAY